MRRSARDDEGSAELTLAVPLMLLLLGLVAQVALYSVGSHVAHATAQHGLVAARSLEATEADGLATANTAAQELRGDLLQDVDITVERTETTATVRVRASVPSLIPWTQWPIDHTVSAPVERAPA